jgi:hypothetical protein
MRLHPFQARPLLIDALIRWMQSDGGDATQAREFLPIPARNSDRDGSAAAR